MELTEKKMNEIMERGKRLLVESRLRLADSKLGLHRSGPPVEHFTPDQKPFVKVELIFLVTDPELPGFVISFSDEEACNHYCLTNHCIYTSIPLYKI